MLYTTECSDVSFFTEKAETVLRQGHKVVLYTKNLTDELIKLVSSYEEQTVVHVTITGWGSTWVEPGVPASIINLEQVNKLLSTYPLERTTIRVDPIIPSFEGVNKAAEILSKLPADLRVISSVLQIYKHSEMLISLLNLNESEFTVNSGRSRYVNKETAQKIFNYLLNIKANISLCGHPYKIEGTEHDGCINETTLKLLNEEKYTKTSQRPGCLCKAKKTQLLSYADRCTHRCVYCYAHKNL